MKHSSISLNELKTVEKDYRKLLYKVYEAVTSHRATIDPEQFQEALGNAAKILSLIRKLSLGDTEREKYIDDVLKQNQTYSELTEPLPALGFTGFTTIIMGLNVKPIRDLHASYMTTLEVKRLEEMNAKDAEVGIRELQQKVLRAGRTYIETHQQEKLENIKQFRKENPRVENPVVVYASGTYRTGYTVNFFGEILHPNLLVLGTNEKTREELRESIKSQPIKNLFKPFICDQIKEKSSDEIHHGHRVNFDLIVENLDPINKTLSLYHGRVSRKASCVPVYELEGLLPALFEYKAPTPAPFLTGDPEALNMINKFVNTYLVRFGVMPLDYIYPK
jgi:hypothetical protein